MGRPGRRPPQGSRHHGRRRSFPGIRSRSREWPRHARPAPRRRARHQRNPSIRQRARPPERVAPLGRSAHLARAPTRNGARRRDGDRERGRRHLGLRLRARRRTGRPACRTRITIATSGPTASWKPCSNAYRPTKSTRSLGSSSCRSTRSISSTRHAGRRRGCSMRRCVSARYRISSTTG